MQRKTGLALVAIAFLGAGAFYSYVTGNDHDLPDGLASGNGRIEATYIDISTKIAGRVAAIEVEEGALVEPGQTLAQMDIQQLEAQLSRALADVATAESRVAAAQASIAQAEARLLLADQELTRTAALVEKGHIAQETFDIRSSDQKVAMANLNAAKAEFLATQRTVDAANASAAEIRTQIADATLTAPAMGRVLYRLSEPGEVLGAGGRLLTMLNLSDVYIEFFLPAHQAHRVEIGAEARILLDVVDIAIPAQISFVSPVSQFTPRQVETQDERDKLMFRIRARVPNALVAEHIDVVKTGVRGEAFVRLAGADQPAWPDALQNLPGSSAD